MNFILDFEDSYFLEASDSGNGNGSFFKCYGPLYAGSFCDSILLLNLIGRIEHDSQSLCSMCKNLDSKIGLGNLRQTHRPVLCCIHMQDQLTFLKQLLHEQALHTKQKRGGMLYHYFINCDKFATPTLN